MFGSANKVSEKINPEVRVGIKGNGSMPKIDEKGVPVLTSSGVKSKKDQPNLS